MSAQAQSLSINLTNTRPVVAYGGGVTASWGNISAFQGGVNPLWGNISAFQGGVNPFWGNISAFQGGVDPQWGNISAFQGGVTPSWGNISAFQGGLNPFWGNISAFSDPGSAFSKTINAYGGDISPFWGNISAFWGGLTPLMNNISGSGGLLGLFGSDATTLSKNLNDLESRSQAFWGTAIKAQTGLSFRDGFAKAIYAKYGIDPDRSLSLALFDQGKRNAFLLDWFDGLMSFTGTDRVDWWMTTARWSPALTQIQGTSDKTVIGLLDMSIQGTTDFKGNLTKYDGVSSFSNGHGAAVASLLLSPHDGQGLMGIAPASSVVAYNPFDATGTTNWTDVTTGVRMLLQNNARVVNMSLGERGWTLPNGWYDVFSDKTVAAAQKNTVFVIAAGNDGVSQTTNVKMNYAANPAYVVVGSIGPDETISDFSNKPGTANILDEKGKVKERLMDRFLVAPGEMILTSDGDGGVTRRSGTSFAAPLVSGAVALMVNRWPWMSDHPNEIVDVLLDTAKDLGAPGVDPVYGAGLLDIEGSQSPIDFNKLKYYQPKATTKPAPAPKKDEDAVKAFMSTLQEVKLDQVRNMTDATVSSYETKGLYLYAFEQLGGTFRDFAIPMSSKLVGQSVLSAGGTQERFQSYVYGRLADWQSGGAGTVADSDKPAPKPKPAPKYSLLNDDDLSFASGGRTPVSTAFGLDFAVKTKPWTQQLGYRASQTPMQTDLKIVSADKRNAFRFGYGDGASALTGMNGFTSTMDSSSELGGVNPVLGLASGGGFAKWSTAVTPRLTFSAGVSDKRARLDLNQLTSSDRLAMVKLGEYRATATNVSLSYKASDSLQLTAGVTDLNEPNALLGTRSLNPADFAGGSRTKAATVGASWLVGQGLRLSASGTLGDTRDGSDGANTLRTAGGGLRSTAYEFALDKVGVFDGADHARVTFAQPLTVDGGKLSYSGVQVVDRQTGELGVVTQTVSARQDRRYVAEFLYGRSILSGAGEWGLFGRAESQSIVSNRTGPEMMAGARFRLSY